MSDADHALARGDGKTFPSVPFWVRLFTLEGCPDTLHRDGLQVVRGFELVGE